MDDGVLQEDAESDAVKSRLSFSVSTASDPSSAGPRTGLLHRRKDDTHLPLPSLPIPTPNFVATTSRGVVPHLTPDMLARHTQLAGVYMSLEDFIEKAPTRTPPLLSLAVDEQTQGLRGFTSLPASQLLILGARRSPPVPTPMTNGSTAVAVCTSDGFYQMQTDYYVQAARQLRPDVVIGLGDVSFPLSTAAGSRRRDKMAGRTERWLEEQLAAQTTDSAALFAPVLPIDASTQAWYLEALVANIRQLSGLAVYDNSTVPELPSALSHLPRLSLAEPRTPHDILAAVAAGIDIFTAPFVAQTTDVGIAFDFVFGVAEDAANDSVETIRESVAVTDDTNGNGNDNEASVKLPLGLDCTAPHLAADLQPLAPGCTCYACTAHHRAYVHHLLAAKEMLAWVLLAVHNHAVLTRFFAAVRQSIVSQKFAADSAQFSRKYETSFQSTATSNVRMRGYQRKSEGAAVLPSEELGARPADGSNGKPQKTAEARLNRPAWKGL